MGIGAEGNQAGGIGAEEDTEAEVGILGDSVSAGNVIVTRVQWTKHSMRHRKKNQESEPG